MAARNPMNIPKNLCGCHISEAETDAACNALAAAGCDPIAANRPSLRGSWERNGRRPIFLTDADDDQAWLQHHGTCVGQGFGHAVQTSIRYSLKYGSRVGNPDLCRIAWEPSYILSRTEIGQNKLGAGDGSFVPWICLAGYYFGLANRQKFGDYDLTEDREDWAYQLSQPSDYDFPPEITEAMKNIRLVAAMKVTDLDTAADCLDCGFPLIRGADRATGPQRDVDGISRTVACGGHCEHLPGVFMDRKGRRVWLERNSWRGTPGQPHGGGTFKLADGMEKPVPDGCGGLLDEDVQYYIQTGDLWAVEPPEFVWGSQEMSPSEFA